MKRGCIVDRSSLLDALRGGAHRPVRESLQPQNPRIDGARIHGEVDREIRDLLTAGGLVVSQDAFEMASCTPKIPVTMLDHAEHALASKLIWRSSDSEAVIFLRQFKRNTRPPAVEMKRP